MSNPITVSDEAVEAALTVWSAAAWDNIRRTLAKEGGTLPDPAAAMRAALEAAAPFMCEVQPAQSTQCETCHDTGEVDERLGGEPTNGIVPCPDCSQAQPAPSVGEGYTFCTKCGETIKYPTITERARAAEAKLRVAVEALRPLSAFVRYVLAEGSWAGHGIDGGDAQDAAERFGLIASEPYDPAKHGYHADFNDGDRWLTFTPLVLPLSSIGEV
jgi:hypothetical protein